MLRYFTALLALWCVLPLPALATGEHYKVWIVAGQSNAVGNYTVASLPELDLALPQTNVLYYNATFPASGWGPLQPGPPQMADFDYSAGPELSFGYDIAKAHPADHIAIIKLAVNSTNLIDNWLGVDSDHRCSPNGIDCSTLLLGAVTTALADPRLAEHELAGVIWMQGESDAEQSGFAYTYGQNLGELIDLLRSGLNAPLLPFIYGRIQPRTPFPYTSIVRHQQNPATPVRPGALMVNTDDIPVAGYALPDNQLPSDSNFHFTQIGQEILGSRFAAAALGEAVGHTSFFPDVSTAPARFSSNLTLRNNSNRPRNIAVALVDGNGLYQGGLVQTVAAHRGQAYQPALSGFAGAALVYSLADIGGVARQVGQPFGVSASGAYTALSEAQRSAVFNVPVAMHQWPAAYGVGNSQIVIQNTGTQPVVVHVHFTPPAPGLPDPVFSLRAGARSTPGFVRMTAPWQGSVKIRALTPGGQLGVIANLMLGPASLQTLAAFPVESGGAAWLVPQVMAHQPTPLGLGVTRIVVENVSTTPFAAGTVTLTCSGATGSPFSVATTYTLARQASYVFNPAHDARFPSGWQGNCRLNAPAAVVSYSAPFYSDTAGTRLADTDVYWNSRMDGDHTRALFPVISKRLADGSVSAVTVQNLSPGANAQMVFSYYAAPGCQGCQDTRTTVSLAPHATLTEDVVALDALGLPDGWFGSLEVQSSTPVDGYAQLSNAANPPGDTLETHRAISRP